MKSNLYEKIGLFLLSLWLLFLLIFVLKLNIPIYFGHDWEFIGFKKLLKLNIIPTICLFLILIGVVIYLRFDYKIEGSTLPNKTIDKVENANYEHLSFLATYIIPLICFDFDNPRYILILFLVLMIIGAIYVKTNIFYANPTLALLGFHIYEVTFTDESKTNIIITKRQKLIAGDVVSTIKLDDKIYYGRKKI